MIKVSKNIFELKNKEICYIIAVNEYGYLENLYFGKRIDYMPFVKNRRILRGHGVSIAGEKDRLERRRDRKTAQRSGES